MENNERARQFLPFDALKGFKEAIAEKQKTVVEKKVISPEDEASLNYKMNQITKGMMIQLIYFKENEYLMMEGLVSKIDKENKCITIVKTKIPFDDIISIQGKDIKDDDEYGN